MASKVNELVKQASRMELTPEDHALQQLTREQVLSCSPEERLRWFHLRPVGHRELLRVADDVAQLMEECNDVSIISLIGLSGVGKTTAAKMITNDLYDRYSTEIEAGQTPVLYVEAPANGEKSLSWRVLYQRILHAGGELAVSSMRGARVVNGRLISGPGRASVAELREFIETMVRQRGVRVLIIDEALHLLRFEKYDAVMDTLKSLSDIEGLKLILIGSYQIAPLMLQYGQVARRSEIVHFRPYVIPKAKEAKSQLQELPKAPRGAEPGSDAFEFYSALNKNLKMWPCTNVPDLGPWWWHLMEGCLGSVGLLKMFLLRLASQQIQSRAGAVNIEMMKKAGKSPKALQKLEDELNAGLEELRYACYGEAKLSEEYRELMQAVMQAGKVPAEAEQAHA